MTFFAAVACQAAAYRRVVPNNPASFQFIQVPVYGRCISQKLEGYIHHWHIHLFPLTTLEHALQFHCHLPLCSLARYTQPKTILKSYHS